MSWLLSLHRVIVWSYSKRHYRALLTCSTWECVENNFHVFQTIFILHSNQEKRIIIIVTNSGSLSIENRNDKKVRYFWYFAKHNEKRKRIKCKHSTTLFTSINLSVLSIFFFRENFEVLLLFYGNGCWLRTAPISLSWCI